MRSDRDPAERRVRLDLGFVGTPFRGWQSQARGRTVQDCLEEALCKVGHGGLRCTGCSRTDAGVHARLFTAHAGFRVTRPLETYLKGLNSALPQEIRIYRVCEVPGDFHARFSCIGKTYLYHLYTGPVVPPHLAPFVWPWRGRLDLDSMRHAAGEAAGDHDFALFTTKEGREKNTRLTLGRCQWDARGPFLILRVEGRSFLHRMVRCLAGALVGVGTGRLELDQFRAALRGDPRAPQIPALPAQGLALWEVHYPAEPAKICGSCPEDPIFPL